MILQEAEKRLGHRVDVQLALIRHWANRGGTRAPQALAQLEHDLASWTEGDREALLRGLAEAYLRIGDAGATNRLLSQLVERRPLDLGLRFTQFEQALRAGDDAAMQVILDQLRAIEDDPQTPEKSEGVFWRCGQARYLLWSTRNQGRGTIEPKVIGEVRLLLAEAGNERPSWPQVPLIMAETDDLARNREGALRNYLRAIELGMADHLVVRRAVELLFELRRFEQADGLIRKWQEQSLGSGDPQLQRLAAEVSLRINDPARALELARQSIPPGSKDYRDHLWLGQFYWAAGEIAKAEPELRRSVELGGSARRPG